MVEKRYNVLWIDDESSIHEGYQILADAKGIDLFPYTCWKDAENDFKARFNEWTAIILDANCKWASDSLLDGNFLNEVLVELRNTFSEKKKFIPWYVLSAGTMIDFNSVIKSVNSHDRKEHIQDWGDLVFLKDDIQTSGSENPLFENICRIGDKLSCNTILYRHDEVFRYLGEDRYFSSEARRLLLDTMSALYFPEENVHFKFEGNPIRRILEYVFRGSITMGLLPEECLDSMDHLNLQDCCNFFDGKELKYMDNKPATLQIKPKTKILSPTDSSLIKGIKNYFSSNSHTGENDEFVIEDDKKDLFFSYVMQLCHVIMTLGKFLDEHGNPDINRENITRLPILEQAVVKKETALVDPRYASYIGLRGLIEKDEHGLCHIGECAVIASDPYVGRSAIITEASENMNKHSNYFYKVFAKYKKE